MDMHFLGKPVSYWLEVEKIIAEQNCEQLVLDVSRLNADNASLRAEIDILTMQRDAYKDKLKAVIRSQICQEQ